MLYFTSGPLGASPELVDDAAVYPLGTMAQGADGNKYKYIEAKEDLAQYAASLLDEDGGADELTTAAAGDIPACVVVPQVEIATGKFGWAVCSGRDFKILGRANAAADVKTYTHTTAGVVDDDAAGKLIHGLRLNTAVGGSQEAVSASSSEMSVNAES